MTSIMHSSIWVLCGLVGTAHLPSQQQDVIATDRAGEHRGAAGRRALSSAHGVWREGDLLCGGGLRYRVEFSTAGAVYVPALPSAARSYPVRFVLADIGRGGVDPGWFEDARPRSDGIVVGYDRGCLVERYALGPHGIEQSFVLRRPLVGSGDLVLRQRIVTDLLATAHGDCSAGLALHDPEGVGGVTIGRAVAVDARGVRTALEMAFDGTSLEIRAPHLLLERAAYPLVLDPPVGTVLHLSAAGGDVDPDVAWDETARCYLAVWSRGLSVTASEIFGQRLDPAGSPIGPLVPIRTGTDAFATNPAVAAVEARSRFCVVWQQGGSAAGAFDLYCRAVAANSGAISGIVHTSRHSANDVDPDIAGAIGTDDRAVVVWSRAGFGIRSIALDVPGTGDPRPTTARSVGSSAHARLPAITKSGGANGVPVVLWQQNNRVEGTALDRSGQRLGSGLVVAGTVLPGYRPDVAGDGRGGYLAVYERSELGGRSRDVYCRALRFDGARLVHAGGERPVENHASDDERFPAVGYMAGLYLVAWTDEGGGFLDHDVVLQAVAPDGGTYGPRALARNDASAFDAYPEIATQHSGGGAGDQALVVFSALDNTNLTTSVHGHVFEAFVGDGTVRRLGGGCGAGGTISADGPVAVGNLLFGLDLTCAGVPDGAALLLLGVAGVPTSVCGPCSLVTPILVGQAPLRGGTASFDLPLPTSMQSAVGAAVEVQWVVFGAATSPCAAVPGLAATERLELTLGR